MAALAPVMWFVGLGLMVLLAIVFGSPLVLFFAVIAAFDVYHRWSQLRKGGEQTQKYYRVSRRNRVRDRGRLSRPDRAARGGHGRDLTSRAICSHRPAVPIAGARQVPSRHESAHCGPARGRPRSLATAALSSSAGASSTACGLTFRVHPGVGETFVSNIRVSGVTCGQAHFAIGRYEHSLKHAAPFKVGGQTYTCTRAPRRRAGERGSPTCRARRASKRVAWRSAYGI